MAQTGQSAPFQWGQINQLWFYSAVPSLASDGPFKVGDWVINSTPGSATVAVWVCTTAGTGATAVFKTLTLSA